MNIEMGNQQAKETDLAWLAGIIDGEGSILLGTTGHGGNYKGMNVRAMIHITNTDANIISKCQDIIEAIGLSVYIQNKKPTTSNTPVFRLDIGKMNHIKTLLDAIMPYLIGKIGQAKLVLKFVEKRLAKGKAHYDDEDISNIEAYYSTYHGLRNKTAVFSKPQRLNGEQVTA